MLVIKCYTHTAFLMVGMHLNMNSDNKLASASVAMLAFFQGQFPGNA